YSPTAGFTALRHLRPAHRPTTRRPLLVAYQGREVMKRGPKRLVTEAFIKRVAIFLAEKDRPSRELLLAAANHLGLKIRPNRSAGPANPDMLRAEGRAR